MLGPTSPPPPILMSCEMTLLPILLEAGWARQLVRKFWREDEDSNHKLSFETTFSPLTGVDQIRCKCAYVFGSKYEVFDFNENWN
jgi:hypothetical protein